MNILIKNVEGFKMPEQAHPGEDVGWDIFAASDPKICGEANGIYYKSISYIEYDTNVCIAPISEIVGNLDKGVIEKWINYHVEIFPRSSITKYNLILKNSIPLIDQGYRDSIKLRFAYIIQPEDLTVINVSGGSMDYGVCCRINKEKIYKKGDKIGQIVVRKTYQAEFMKVAGLPDSKRGDGKFGSSGI